MFDLISREWFESLRPIAIPATLLWGKRDNVLSAQELEYFKRLFETVDIQVEPEWAHFPMLDRPEEYATKIHSLSSRLIGVK